MAADSLCSLTGGRAVERRTPKIWEHTLLNGEKILFGVEGRLKLHQILHFCTELAELPAEGDIGHLVVKHWLPAIEKSLRNAKLLYTEDDEEQVRGGFIIGLRGTILTVDSNLAVSDFVDPFAAIGSGMEVARGVLYALSRIGTDLGPEERLRLAVETAGRYFNSVGGPTTVLYI